MSKVFRRFTAASKWCWPIQTAYRALAPRAWTAILAGALFCNLAVKFYHAVRYGLLIEYPLWILTDLAVLLAIGVLCELVCYRWPRKWVLRSVTIFAALICTWSVMNAGWVIRTGTQILPMELRPLIRDPLNIFWVVAKNLAAAPIAACILLIPSAVALAFLFYVLARPEFPQYDRRRLKIAVIVALSVASVTAVAQAVIASVGSPRIAGGGLQFNCQARAVLSFVLSDYRHLAPNDFSNSTHELPRVADLPISVSPRSVRHNIVIVVLEGVQYSCTSLATGPNVAAGPGVEDGPNPTPFLATLAAQGASFTNARSTVTHTTKALFALLTGRPPSASQDTGEAIPVAEPYAGLATILEEALDYRTAFFQSAKGTFESRPGLVHNLGFDTFFAREDLGDPNSFVGYLGADEFALLEPMSRWIESDDKPFLLVALCSVTHDPYEVPEWFGPTPGEPAELYEQAIRYTDRYVAALDVMLRNLNLADQTIFCVVGDHGEAFAEHRMMGHERIAYDEVLRIPMCLRAPFLLEPGTRIDAPVSSVDLTPTLLSLLGFDIEPMEFAGADVLAPLPQDRKVFFSGWMQQGPSGFIEGDNKIVFDPEHGIVTLYRLSLDPLELVGLEFPEKEAQRLSREIVEWRRSTIFRLRQEETGQAVLFDSWLSKWNGRSSKVKHLEGR